MNTSQFYNTEYLKERIYGSITLLAVNIWLFLHLEHTSKIQAFSTILTTILGLWLASLFAEILAHKTLHKNKNKEEWRHFYIHTFKNSLGILNSSKTSIFLIILTFCNIISLKVAVFSAIVMIGLEFLLILLFAKKSNNFIENIIIILSQIILFGIIILLKLGH